ncbi:claudin-like protein ZF-A89 [Megalops cyprinoides]|uniref:claudin-like protein ZF-A89 n=1 Tax=Megalops cyprinoides TaxID=118141 RepID=UPI001863DA5A|nr:claudin-like protein ZF-A89 [Megalops cyprinoides]
MGRIAKEVAGQVFLFTGFLGVIIVCGIPMWRVTSYVGANIVTGQIIWDGLWMNCIMQSTGQMQCKMHESLLKLSRDLQAARALIIISIVVGFVGLLMTFIGGKCTSCLDNDSSKAKVVIFGGILSIIAGVLCLIPICWSATTTITDFQNPLINDSQRRELGSAIFIGWGTSALLIIGGSILCTSCPPEENVYGYRNYPPQYIYPGSVVTTGTYMPAKTYMPSRPNTAPEQYIPNQAYTATRPYSPGNYV